MGRPAVFSYVAIQLCLSVKVLFKLPLRQAVGMVRALLKLAGLDWPVPDYFTLCRRQKTLTVHIPYHYTIPAPVQFSAGTVRWRPAQLSKIRKRAIC